MADAIISQVVDRVTAIIQDQISNEVNLGRGREMELLDLSNKLNTIRNVLDVAEMRGVNDQRIKNWLKKLRGTSYDIDNILDEWEYSLPRHNMEAEQKVGCSFIPSSCLHFKKLSVRYNAAKTIENVKAKLAPLLNEMDQFEFVRMLNGGLANSQPATNISWQKQATSSIDFKIYVGSTIYTKKNDIVNKLMLNGGNIQILSIVGVGGVGKTTLARLIYNDTQFVKDNFDLRIWICVSHPFDMVGVAREIVASVTGDTIPLNIPPLEIVLNVLGDCISKKKFLLVLDDVGTHEIHNWKPLKICLNYGALGSKVLVTTKYERVAQMMGTLDDDIYRLEELSEEECWLILRDESLNGKSEEECGEFKVVGKKIARKCKGLPLATNILGRLLRFKTSLEEWKRIEKSEIWQLENAKVDLFPHLFLSYSELPLAHKHCFSYCAVYPKDYQYHAESLIEEWMALGYLGSVSGNSEVELIGRECLDNLAMCFLFQDIEKSELGGEIEWCKMHDIVHDFALFLRENNEGSEMRNRSCQVCDPLLVSQAREYHRLFWKETSLLRHCDCLNSVRVLRIENGLPPVGMERFIHLRWLDFSGIALSKDGFEIICRFYFLQTLSLARCNLIEISPKIGNLVHLRRLDLSCNKKLKELPESMYSLVELRTLSLACCSLKEVCGEIGNLIKLRQLDLSRNKELKELPGSMYSLVELRTLSLAYCSLKEIPRKIGKFVELRRLDLSWNEELKELPGSMYSLVELRTLSLANCSVEEIHEEIGNLVHLRKLDLSGNVLLKELPESMCHLVELRTLSLAYCSLKEIGGEIGDLICLTQLDLRWNRELNKLPESIHKLVELQILNIEGTKVHHRLPEAVGQLSNLTLEVRELKVGSHYNNLGLLKKVKHSTGSLTLDISFSTMSEMVELVEDAREVRLKSLFQELENLKISFEGTMNGKEPSSSSLTSSSMWKKLLEALEPHHELKQLTIWKYKGSMLPHWMSSRFNCIKEISLHYLSEVSSLPALGKLPFLEVLYIDHLEGLKLVGREFLGIESASHDDIVVAFPKLKELTFDTCPKWEEWEDITEEEEEESAVISIMPCLRELSINSCNSLKKLPHRLLHKAASSLQMLNIEESSELVATYSEDKEGSPWRSISQHNPQLVRYL